tara:strand:- start:318 stop:458 length:141 start_codon:yes stop_codon:yes gene_type:complete
MEHARVTEISASRINLKKIQKIQKIQKYTKKREAFQTTMEKAVTVI